MGEMPVTMLACSILLEKTYSTLTKEYNYKKQGLSSPKGNIHKKTLVDESIFGDKQYKTWANHRAKVTHTLKPLQMDDLKRCKIYREKIAVNRKYRKIVEERLAAERANNVKHVTWVESVKVTFYAVPDKYYLPSPPVDRSAVREEPTFTTETQSNTVQNQNSANEILSLVYSCELLCKE